MIKDHIFPLTGALGILLLGFGTLPDALAQSTLPGSTELPPTVLAIPVIGDFLQGISKWIPVIMQIIGMFATIAAVTANKTDDKIVNMILTAINFLGFNFGTAKNDPKVGVTQK